MCNTGSNQLIKLNNWLIITFIDKVKNYLTPDIDVRRGDVLSAWAGIRPLVKDPNAPNTQSLGEQ